MSDIEKYIEAAYQELCNPTFAVSEQYLAVMPVAVENEAPKVARVDLDRSDSSVAVYFSVEDEQFYIVVNLSRCPEPEVEWVWIESGHRVYLSVTSDDLSYQQMAEVLPLPGLTG